MTMEVPVLDTVALAEAGDPRFKVFQRSEPFDYISMDVYQGRIYRSPFRSSQPTLFVMELRNAIVRGGIIITEEGELLGRGMLHNFRKFRRVDIPFFSEERATVNLPEIAPLSGSYIYLGGSNNFYHFMFNSALRAMIVAQDARLVSVPSLFSGLLNERQSEWLTLLGLPDHIPADYSTTAQSIEHLFVPCMPFRHDVRELETICGSRFVLDAARKKLAPNSTSHGRRRVYLSRADAQWRRITNEVDFAPMLRDYGFDILSIGGLNAADQIRLMADCEIVMGPHGSQLGTAFLAPASATYVELFHPLYRRLDTMMLPPALSGQKIWRIFGNALGPGDADFVIDPGHIKLALDAIVREAR